MVWSVGCWAGDDYDMAMQEVADTQDLNTRTTKEKTYHLVISFRPEDETKLTLETFKEIEKEFAEVLGFQEHQRHCGVHQNTANLHMHIAYNMIHPEKLTRHEPYRDFHKRDQLCYILLSLALDIEFSISNGDVGYIVLALLSLLGSAIFYAPFCFVFFRRLKGVGFTHPRLATWLLFIAIVIFSLFAIESAITIEIIATLLHVLPYLVLMIFKDKKTQIIAE